MHYEWQLQFLRDTLQRGGIQTVLADLTSPPSRHLATGHHFLLSQELSGDKPLREYLHTLSPATVYTFADWMDCCYTFFQLPELTPDTLLVIGPYLTAPLTEKQILEYTELGGIDARNHKRMELYYTSLPLLPKNSQLHLMLDTFFELLWGVGGYTAETVSQEQLRDIYTTWPGLQLSEEEHALVDMAIMEERYSHENELIDAVRQGQLWRLKSFLSRLVPTAFEQRVPDPVRNVKNYCIITNTLLRKAAEQGGVHPFYLNSLSSSFAARIEQLPSAAAGPSIIEEMAYAYCRLVRNHTTKGYSAPIQKTILIIDSDLSAKLTLSYLAQEVNVNSSYLSALFKKETGVTLTDYIAQHRIRHASHLLKTTRLQIQTVGQYCGYEDVHYFSKIFKRLTGLTPMQYRKSITTK